MNFSSMLDELTETFLAYQIVLEVFRQVSYVDIEVIDAVDVRFRLEVDKLDLVDVDCGRDVEDDGALGHFVAVEGHVDGLTPGLLSLVRHSESFISVVWKKLASSTFLSLVCQLLSELFFSAFFRQF